MARRMFCLNIKLSEGNYKLSKTWQLRTLEFTGRNFTEESRAKRVIHFTPGNFPHHLHHNSEQLPQL